jgi:hypothetical protein
VRSSDSTNKTRTMRLIKRGGVPGKTLHVTLDVAVVAEPRIAVPLWSNAESNRMTPLPGRQTRGMPTFLVTASSVGLSLVSCQQLRNPRTPTAPAIAARRPTNTPLLSIAPCVAFHGRRARTADVGRRPGTGRAQQARKTYVIEADTSRCRANLRCQVDAVLGERPTTSSTRRTGPGSDSGSHEA